MRRGPSRSDTVAADGIDSCFSRGKRGSTDSICSDGGDGSPVAVDCSIADDRFEPFIDAPTKFGEGPHWVKPRRTATSAIRRLFIQLLNNLRNPGNAAMRQNLTHALSKRLSTGCDEFIRSPRRRARAAQDAMRGWDGFCPYYAGYPEPFARSVLASAGGRRSRRSLLGRECVDS